MYNEEPSTSLHELGTSHLPFRRWRWTHHGSLCTMLDRTHWWCKLDPPDRSKQNDVKEEGSRITRLGDCWIEQAMCRKSIEATRELKNDLRKRKGALAVLGGTLDTQGLEEDVQKSLRFKEDGTVEVHKWITEVPCDSLRGLANTCKDGRLKKHLPQWTNKVIGRSGSQVFEDNEARKLRVTSDERCLTTSHACWR